MSGCSCCHCHEEEHLHDHGHDHHGEGDGVPKREVLRLILGGALLGISFLPVLPELAAALLCLTAFLIAGIPVLAAAGRRLLHREWLDECFLMSIASIGAFAVGEYPEAAAVMLLYQLGELLQDYAAGRSRRSIRALMDIRPDLANLLEEGESRPVPAESVPVGATILIRPGEKIPLDGVVLTGCSALDQSALTGESLPREVCPGEEVLSGSINQSGALTIQVTRSFHESTASRILEAMEHSLQNKAKTERFITRFARIYTPIVVLAAVLIALIPILMGADWREYCYRALNFLVISCPCALVISVPLSFFAGMGCASRLGILVKGGGALEGLGRAGIVAFDKTGTLTQGRFSVCEIRPEGLDAAALLITAASAEQYSSHPMARSIVEAAAAESLLSAEEVREQPGKGISARIRSRVWHFGTADLLAELGIAVPEETSDLPVIHAAEENCYRGCILLRDQLRPESAWAVAGLRKLGIDRLVLLTGDREASGKAVQSELGLDEAHCRLLPTDKVERLQDLQQSLSPKQTLLFLGDGINDAPVLATADVGVAMGGHGADAALEAADAVLLTDDPARLCDAIHVARRTLSIARQNVVFSISVKILVLILSGLGYAEMWMSIFADVGVALLAVCNALRALQSKGRATA